MDSILFWNEVALEANRVSHTNGKLEQVGPTLSSRALAIVHLAMYDAYAGIARDPANLPHYTAAPIAPPATATGPDAADAAVAAAAHATLSKLFPSQKPFFDMRHAKAGLSGGSLQAGHQYGLQVAQAILEERKNDPDRSDDGYAASMARGAHRPDPDNPDQGYYSPFYGARSKCFAVTDRHELLPPPARTSDPYLRALKEVRAKGIAPHLMGTLPSATGRRNADETLIGIYWGYDGAAGLGTPPRLYNQIVREVAAAQGNNTALNARLFALVNAAMADAGILAWDQKYIHDLWRPVVGIREHDESMGPTGLSTDDIVTDCDPSWLPLGAPKSNELGKNFTPNFPAYPSGHATFGAAAFQMTRLFYGVPMGDCNGDLLFQGRTFVSDEFNGFTKDNTGAVRPRHARSFSGGLWQMIEENGRSRVYLGVHWVFDAFYVDKHNRPDFGKNIGGVPLGLKIAEDIFNGARPDGLRQSTVGPRT